MAIAPWLELPNFVGAAQAGSQQQDTHAQLALQREKQQQDAGNQAAELALRRDEMMLNAQHASDSLRAQQQQTQAAQALRQQQIAQQLGLGQERIGVEQAGVGERQTAADQLNAYRQNELEDKVNGLINPGGSRGKLAPEDEDSVKTIDERLVELQKNMDAMRFSPNPDQDQMMKLQGAINDLGRQKQSVFSKYNHATLPSTQTPAPQSTPAAAALGSPVATPMGTSGFVSPINPAAGAGAGLTTPNSKSGIPTINSQEEYDQLSAGSQYLDSNGKLATKKGSASQSDTQ